MRIVVTGATGNVGTSLLSALANDPRVEEIVGVARRLPRLQVPRTRWVQADMGLAVPVMDTRRAREELGWAPSRDAASALRELLDGMRDRAGADTPPLDADAGGPLRVRELLSGVGRVNR